MPQALAVDHPPQTLPSPLGPILDRARLVEAVAADFGHRSHQETS